MSTTTLRQVPITCNGHTRPVVDLRFSDVTKYSYFLISACKDGIPMLREGDTGDWIGSFIGHKGAVWGATITGNAELAATAGSDFTAKLWDANTGAELQTFEHKHIVRSVDFSSINKEWLLTGSNEKILKIYDVTAPTEPVKVFSGHSGAVKKETAYLQLIFLHHRTVLKFHVMAKLHYSSHMVKKLKSTMEIL